MGQAWRLHQKLKKQAQREHIHIPEYADTERYLWEIILRSATWPASLRSVVLDAHRSLFRAYKNLSALHNSSRELKAMWMAFILHVFLKIKKLVTRGQREFKTWRAKGILLEHTLWHLLFQPTPIIFLSFKTTASTRRSNTSKLEAFFLIKRGTGQIIKSSCFTEIFTWNTEVKVTANHWTQASNWLEVTCKYFKAIHSGASGKQGAFSSSSATPSLIKVK